MINHETLNRYQREFEKKYQELEENYNYTGSVRTYRSMCKYSDMIQIIRFARKQLDGGCVSCERHERNIDAAINRYESYQAADIKDLEKFSSFITDLKSLRF